MPQATERRSNNRSQYHQDYENMGFYFGGPAIGGSGIGLIPLICLVVYFMGGFRK
jgi:hypothetical protein